MIHGYLELALEPRICWTNASGAGGAFYFWNEIRVHLFQSRKLNQPRGGVRWRGPGTLPEPGRRPWRTTEGPSKARAHWALRPGPPAHSAVGSSTPFQLAADRDTRQLAACAGDAAGASRRMRHEALWHTGAAGGEHFAARAHATRPGTLRMGLWHTRPLTCAPSTLGMGCTLAPQRVF